MLNFKFFKSLENTKNNSMFYFVFILFVLSFLIRFVLADFPKHLLIQPDELLFYQIAENFAQNRGLMVYNLPSNYQNVLYSIFLMPAFFFENREMQQHIISLINSILITSCLFPIYFLAKLFLKQKKSIIAVLLFSLIIPDLTYSVTFMAENLYLPIALWLFYFYILWIIQNKHSVVYSLFLGVFTFFALMCKMIALFFPLALIIYCLLHSRFLPPVNLNYKTNNKNNKIKQFKSIFIILSVVFIFYFLMQKLFFFHLENYYNYKFHHSQNFHSTFDFVLDCLMQFLFLIGSFFVFLSHILLGSGFFPVLFSFVFFQKLNHTIQTAILFLSILLIITAFVVTTNIYWTEDFNGEHVRTLTRYILYSWILFWIFFFAVLELNLFNSSNLSNFNFKFYFKNNVFKNAKLLFLIFLFFSMLLFFNGSYHRIPMDNTMLFSLDLNSPKVVLFYKIIVLFLCLLFYFQKRIFLNVFLGFILVFYFLNNLGLYWEYKNIFYQMNENEKKSITQVENFVKNNPQKQFLFLNATWINKHQSLADSFLNYANMATSDIRLFLNNQISHFEKTNIMPLWRHSNSQNNYVYQFKQVDYFIFPSYLNGKVIMENKIMKIKAKADIPQAKLILKNEHFFIFENPNPQTMPKIKTKPFDDDFKHLKPYPFLLDYPHNTLEKILFN